MTTTTIADSGVRAPRRVSRLNLLLLALAIAGAAFFVVRLVPSWRGARYERMPMTALAVLCREGREGVTPCRTLARRAVAARKPQEAMEAVQTARDSLPASRERTQLTAALSLLYALAGRHHDAEPLYHEAIQENFESADAHLAFAIHLLQQKALKPALDELKIVTTIEPENDIAWYLMSDLYAKNNKIPEATDAAQRAIAANPTLPEHYQALGDAYGYANQQEKSLAAYRDELLHAPKGSPAERIARADVARALALTAQDEAGRLEAVQSLTEAIDSGAANPASAYLLLGELQMRFGKYPEARRALEASIAADPSVPEVHFTLSRVCGLLGDTAAAERAAQRFEEREGEFRAARNLQKKISEQPNNASYHRELAQRWERYGAPAEAAVEYREVLRILPGDPAAQEGLRRLQALTPEEIAARRKPRQWILDRLFTPKDALDEPEKAGR